MKKQNLERLIGLYEAGLQYPEASGMEHLNMLQIRSDLVDLELSTTQQIRLTSADWKLFVTADKFLHSIQQIADLKSWRNQEGSPPEQWWWYLDVLVNAPPLITPSIRTMRAKTASVREYAPSLAAPA